MDSDSSQKFNHLAAPSVVELLEPIFSDSLTGQDSECSIDELLEGLDQARKDRIVVFIARLATGAEFSKFSWEIFDFYVNEIDTIISTQMDEILHHETFQQLESTWRGLYYSVWNFELSDPVKIEILDASQDELFEDIGNEHGCEDYNKTSALWQKVYWNAYDEAGIHPYTVIVADYQIDNCERDIQLLQCFSKLCQAAQLPTIFGVGANFFGEADLTTVMSNRYLTEIINENEQYNTWQAFRNDERAKYIGLTLPRFLGRMPYGPETSRTKIFNYTEKVYRDGKDHSLWCNASYALGSNIIRNFVKWGWNMRMTGVDAGGRIENLPIVTIQDEYGQLKVKPPIEALLGQRKELELRQLGFIPLAYWEHTNYACFFEMPSIQKPEADANGASLPYTMLITRIAHYLKYQHLAFAGRSATATEVENVLKIWLNGHLAEMPNPPQEIIMEMPFRDYQITVEEAEEKPGFFKITLELQPHFAIVGGDLNLKLVAYHSI